MSVKTRDRLFTLLIMVLAAVTILTMLWLIVHPIWKGFAHLSWSFIVDLPLDAGRDGGISSILVATMMILAVTLLVAIPTGLGAALWLAEYSRQGERTAAFIRTGLDVLAGVPSIVYGLFGNAFFCVVLGLGYSILSGGLTLACMILPVYIRTCEQGLAMVPVEWRQGSAALAMSRFGTIRHILVPAASPAIVTGLLLGLGRATAETAALLFTSGYVDRMPTSIHDSGRALAIHIYELSMNVTGGDPAAYASATVLMVVIALLNLSITGLVDRHITRRVSLA